MSEVQITLKVENGTGDVKLLYNGKPMPKLCEFDMHFNSRNGQLEFKGKRFKTDKYGQFFVDEETKDTAIENINLLNLFNPHIMNRELVVDTQKSLEWAMHNVYMTSMLNARKLIKERNCEVS